MTALQNETCQSETRTAKKPVDPHGLIDVIADRHPKWTVTQVFKKWSEQIDEDRHLSAALKEYCFINGWNNRQKRIDGSKPETAEDKQKRKAAEAAEDERKRKAIILTMRKTFDGRHWGEITLHELHARASDGNIAAKLIQLYGTYWQALPTDSTLGSVITQQEFEDAVKLVV